MERSLQVRLQMKLFVSGIQPVVVPWDNLCTTIHLSGLFVSLPLVNSWHQEIRVEIYICGGYLSCILARAR